MDQGWAEERCPPPGSAPVMQAAALTQAEATARSAISYSAALSGQFSMEES